MNCPQCGKRMKGDWPDKSRWFNCSTCGDRFFLEDNGELVNALYRGSNNSGKKCENCGQSLSGGSYTAPWENGNNPHPRGSATPYYACIEFVLPFISMGYRGQAKLVN